MKPKQHKQPSNSPIDWDSKNEQIKGDSSDKLVQEIARQTLQMKWIRLIGSFVVVGMVFILIAWLKSPLPALIGVLPALQKIRDWVNSS